MNFTDIKAVSFETRKFIQDDVIILKWIKRKYKSKSVYAQIID